MFFLETSSLSLWYAASAHHKGSMADPTSLFPNRNVTSAEGNGLYRAMDHSVDFSSYSQAWFKLLIF